MTGPHARPGSAADGDPEAGGCLMEDGESASGRDIGAESGADTGAESGAKTGAESGASSSGAASSGAASSGVWPVAPPAKPLHLMNPVVLAYVGDAVFELLVRQRLAAGLGRKPDELHKGAVKLVSAKAQRELLERLQPVLTEDEADVVRRGRNAKSGAPPKGADIRDYRQATALECLFGYLYYAGRFGRMAELLRIGEEYEPPADGAAAARCKEEDI